MTIHRFGSLPFRAVLLSTAVAGFAGPALAQPQDEDAGNPPVQATPPASRAGDEVLGQPQEEQAIIVTGSRIQRRDLTSTSPLAVVQDEEFRLSGAVNVEQVINTLPQVVPGATAFSNNPSTGTATLDLRGLGETRTLVLVNGRRWMFYDPNQIVDLNTIPQFLIDSIDVVTGGASAVYGSDALAGVVNFRLRSDLDGLIAGGQYSITEEGDGRRYNAYVAIGTEFGDGRGFVTTFAEYYNRGEILQGDRDFTFFALGDFTAGNTLAPGGSSTPPRGLIRDLLGLYPTFQPGFVFDQPGAGTVWTGDLYNYAPANYMMIPQERWLVGGYAEYEITSGITAFTEASFVNNRVAIELAASPVTGFFDIDVDQACQFLNAPTCAIFQNAAASQGDPDILEDIFVQRRIVEAGSRNQLDERNAFRVLGGIKGPLTEAINYELYYMYARTRNSQLQSGNISGSAFTAGLDGTAPAINIFGAGTLTPEMADQISLNTQNSDIAQLQVANFALSGELFRFGSATSPVGFAIGGEWRSVSARFIPDEALASGDVIGFNAGAPTQGGYDVKEAFAELRIPIVQDGFIHRLELNGAARYSDYSLEEVGGVWTYSAGAELAPVRDITFRGQYQRAVRAPNVQELFRGQGPDFPTAQDPCAQPGAATNAALRDVCIATGVPANRVGDPALQINPQIEALLGGNPDLTEETSDTWTVGAVIQPRFIPRLAVTIDYYDITIEDTIATLGGTPSNILNLCYNVIQDASSIYCQAVRRNQGGIISGDEFSIRALNDNIGGLETSGVDLQIDYSQPLGWSMFGAGESRLNFYFLGNWVRDFTIIPVQDLPDQTNACSGRFGLICGEPIPEYKFTSRLSLIDGPATVSLRWRHVGSLRDDDDLTDFIVEELSSYNLWDLSFAFDVNDHLTINMGVNNLFDTEPELIGDNQDQSNTFPSTFDVLGRDYFVSANFRF